MHSLFLGSNGYSLSILLFTGIVGLFVGNRRGIVLVFRPLLATSANLLLPFFTAEAAADLIRSGQYSGVW